MVEATNKEIMLNKTAKIISGVFHPFFIPIYVMILLLFTDTVHSFYPWKVKVYLLWNVALYSFVLPVLMLALLTRLRRLRKHRFTKREFTIIALLVGACCYILCAITMMKAPSLAIFRKIAVAGVMCELFCLATLPFGRISTYLTAMGAAVALFTMLNILGEMSMFWALLASILCAGLLASARLYMGRNRSLQLFTGFVCGFLLSAAAMMWM